MQGYGPEMTYEEFLEMREFNRKLSNADWEKFKLEGRIMDMEELRKFIKKA